MCGISGFNWADVVLIGKMNSKIKHRGPDDEGTYVDERISLGHTRLSILDLSPRGHQPMCNEDGSIWIVYNGEIYNFKEIRIDLEKKGHKFKSNTDTEMILHAYEESGTGCVKDFNGMWAFCIYDKKKNIMFLSRDHFGIKPLYYYFDGHRLIFSSEIKSILTHRMDVRPNDRIIFDFLYYNLVDHTEETFFCGIKRLMPSHNAIFDLSTGTLTQERYYDLWSRIGAEKFDRLKLKDLFMDSVKYRMIADVPVGSCLSGGIDSSSIVLGMNLLQESNSIETFSAHFPGTRIDERKYQDEIVRLVGSRAHFVSPGPEELLRDIADLVYSQEEPFSSTSIYAQFRIMELAHKNHMKVLLDGQGADEIFAGYHYYLGYYLYELARSKKIARLFSEIKSYRSKTGSIMPLGYLLLRMVPDILKEWAYRTKKVPYLSREFLKDHRARADPRWHTDQLKQALLGSIQIYSLPQLLRFEDKNSMRFSIESRVPFLDYRLVEYVLSMPSDRLISDGITKWAFRNAMEGILPDSIRCRYDKIGFATPEDAWFRNPTIQQFTLDIIGSESFRMRKYWNVDEVRKMFRRMSGGRIPGIFAGTDIWRCISVEMWLRVFIDAHSQMPDPYPDGQGIDITERSMETPMIGTMPIVSHRNNADNA